jgi:stage III sporulation protein AG
MTPKKKNWISKLLDSTSKQQTKNQKLQYLGIVFGLGIILMLTNSIFTQEKGSSPNLNSEPSTEVFADDGETALGKDKSSMPVTIIDLEDRYANQLKELLEEVVGVGDVSVVVNLASTTKKIYEKDLIKKSTTTDETDSQGGERNQTEQSLEEKVVLVPSENGEKPVLVTTKKPDVIGVGVAVEGADNIQVKAWVVEAITRVMGVPSHKVSVLPKQSKGD